MKNDQPNTTEEESEFEFWLQCCPAEMRHALIDVADTAEMCERWFRGKQIPCSAADIVAMAALVLDREKMRAAFERMRDEE
jgi:hypothetical protein